MAFNDRLKESRTNAGLTQEQLSEKLGIAKSTLSGYESGNREPSIATVAKILDILDVDAKLLVSRWSWKDYKCSYKYRGKNNN